MTSTDVAACDMSWLMCIGVGGFRERGHTTNFACPSHIFEGFCISVAAASLPSNQSTNDVKYGSFQRPPPTSEQEKLALPEEVHVTEDKNANLGSYTCGVYMAPSSFPGAGLGIQA